MIRENLERHCAPRLLTCVSDRIGDDIGGGDPQPVEVDLDHTGRNGQRKVAVVAGVGRVQGPRESVVPRSARAAGMPPCRTVRR